MQRLPAITDSHFKSRQLLYSSLNAIKSILVLASGGQETMQMARVGTTVRFLSDFDVRVVNIFLDVHCMVHGNVINTFVFLRKKKQAQRKKVLNEWLSGAWKLYFTLYTPIIEGVYLIELQSNGRGRTKKECGAPEVLCSTRKYKIAHRFSATSNTFLRASCSNVHGLHDRKACEICTELFSSMKSKLLHLEVDIGMSRSDAAVHKLVTRDSDSNITSMRRRINGVFSKTKTESPTRLPKDPREYFANISEPTPFPRQKICEVKILKGK